MPTLSPEREMASVQAAGVVRPARGNRRLASAIVAFVVVAAAIAGALLRAGSGEAGPPTGAAALVPADALAYVHVSTDPALPAVRRALTLAAHFHAFPVIGATALSRVGAIVGGDSSVDFATDIRPWLGKEAAFALLNTTSASAGSLIVLDVRDRARARAFIDRAGARPLGSDRGVTILRYATGTELAFLSHYLVLGQNASVRSAIEVAAGRSESLIATSEYRSAAAGEPADRVLDAYVPASGVHRALMPRGGVLGALGALLSGAATTGTTISVSALPGGARLHFHSTLDPAVARLNGSGDQFAPSLQNAIPSGAPLLLDMAGLDHVGPHILGAAAAVGIAGRLGPLLQRLGTALTSEGVNMRGVMQLFDRESAIAAIPSPGRSQPPALAIVTHTDNEAQTREQLASLEVPFEQLFPAPGSGPGQAPLFGDQQIAGVTVHQLSLGPGLQLDYAVEHGLVIVATSLDAVGAIVHHARSLAHDPAYAAAAGSSPQSVRSLLFLNFSQLLSLGEQTGLIKSSRYQTLRTDLESIRAVGMVSTRGEADTTAELFLQIP